MRLRTSLAPSVLSCLVKLFHCVEIWPLNATNVAKTTIPQAIARTMRELWRWLEVILIFASRESSSRSAMRASPAAAQAMRIEAVRWRPSATAAADVLAFEMSFA